MVMLLGAQLNTFDLDTGFFKGGRCAYVSATAISIEAAACADSTGTYRLSPAAQASVSIATAGAINGLDETTLSATATTTGASASVTMTASLWVETPMTNTVKSLTGTNLSGAGTTITGTGTLFLSELAIGDLIRSVSKGAARVTSIASDLSLTIAAAFPGGNPNGDAGTNTAYENVTFQPNTAVAADKFAINTVTHAGTTIVMSAAISSGAGGSKVAKVGVEIASRWYFPWCVYGGSGTGYILSSQRTRPYGVSGYATAWRRVGSVFNNSSGDIRIDRSIPFGGGRLVLYTDLDLTELRLLDTGVATSWTRLNTATAAPPTASMLIHTMELGSILKSTGAQLVEMQARSYGTTPTYRLPVKAVAWAPVSGTPLHDAQTTALTPIPTAGGFDYQLNATLTSGGSSIDTIGYWEVL